MKKQKVVSWSSLTPSQKLEAAKMLAKFHDNSQELALEYMETTAAKLEASGAQLRIDW